MRAMGAWGTMMRKFIEGLVWGLGFWLAQPIAVALQDLLARALGR